MRSLRFENVVSSEACRSVRREIRTFIAQRRQAFTPEQRALSWTAFDADFSRALGQRAFIGMTFPKAYGGRGASQLERYVVIEELLAAGAPVAAHWMADRQSGPLLLRYGSEALKQEFLPKIAAGEAYFCIGMSEPDAGSDLASVRTYAEHVKGGFVVNGTKLWSTHVTRCPHMIALVRTRRDVTKRHEGLSQFLIDLKGPGITVRPVLDVAGHEHFGEVTFENAFIPEERLIGNEGEGFRQAMAELALERSGPERYLSSFALVKELVAQVAEHKDPRAIEAVGQLAATLSTLRQMSMSVAARLQSGSDVSFEAALVKDLGTSFEQEVPNVVHAVLGTPPMLEGGDTRMRIHGMLSLISPSFSLRGGTREVLRNIIAKELLR